jgi:hypothetical protein
MFQKNIKGREQQVKHAATHVAPQAFGQCKGRGLLFSSNRLRLLFGPHVNGEMG